MCVWGGQGQGSHREQVQSCRYVCAAKVGGRRTFVRAIEEEEQEGQASPWKMAPGWWVFLSQAPPVLS